LTSLSETISHVEKKLPQQQTKRAFFPETSSNTVAYWLLGSAASVFGLVVFGGLTRLTESGYASI
jgi:cytochrome c oxidase assembly protein subunit 15